MEDRVTWESVGYHSSCPAHWMLPSGTLTEKHKNQPSQRSYQDQYVIVKNLWTCRLICSVSHHGKHFIYWTSTWLGVTMICDRGSLLSLLSCW